MIDRNADIMNEQNGSVSGAAVLSMSGCFERYTRNMALTLVVIALLEAIAFFVCHRRITEDNNFQFLTPFIWMTAALLYFFLRKNALIENKRAFVWFIPILLLSVSFWAFEPHFYTALNMPLILCLFAAFAVYVTQPQPGADAGLHLAARTLTVAAGNWYAFLDLLIKVFRRDSVEPEQGRPVRKVFAGVLLAVPVTFVILLLLTAADEVFRLTLAHAFSGSVRFFRFESVAEIIPGLILSLFVFIYVVGYVRQTEKYKGIPLPKQALKKIDPLSSMGFLIPINFLFLIFTVFQVAFLWGNGLMKLPDGVVYSQYARQGFFQLLFVTAINFAILLFYTLVTDTGRTQRRIRCLLISLCLFTGVLVASSFYRMSLYIGNYGYTSLRLSVITFLIMEVFWLFFSLFYLFGGRVRLGKQIVTVGIAFYLLANVTGSLEFSAWMHERYFNIDTVTVNESSEIR